MVWVGKDLNKDHLVPNPLSWPGTPSTRSGKNVLIVIICNNVFNVLKVSINGRINV